MTNSTALGLGAVVLATGFIIGYWFCGGYSFSRGGHEMPGGYMMSQNIDQHFIAQMIPHHEGAIAMARVALERSARPEIRSLAEGIIAAQEQEIADMQNWYEAWFGSAPSRGDVNTSGAGRGMYMGGMEGDLTALSSVPASGFDREFILQMIPHHEMAVMMAGMLSVSTERAEMRELADNIITSQSREIQMMRSWLVDWYGR